jgi:hypothetical protein
MDVSPIDVQRHLGGLTYPAEREDVISHAEAQGAPDEVLDLLDGLGDRTFDGPDDVMAELGGD